MILCFIILCQQSSLVFTFITRDSSLTMFQMGSSCVNGDIENRQINFSDTFENEPQIIVVVEKTDSVKASGGKSLEINFNIQSVTLTSFEINFICPSLKVTSLWFRWYAIDDDNIEVINQFNINSFNEYNISNPNALSGFISIINVGYSGDIDFLLKLSPITSTILQVQFMNPSNLNGNLKSISFQIILAPSSYINLIDTITATQTFTSSEIAVLQNSIFLLPLQGYTYGNAENIRLQIDYLSTNPIKYTQKDWYTDYFVTNVHLQLQLKFINYLQLKCERIRISKMFSPIIPSSSIIFNILEIATSFTEGEYLINIDSSIQSINFSIQFRCQVGKKIVSTFFMNPEKIGAQQMVSQSQNCYGEGNLITYYPRFIQQMVSNSKISIILTSTSCQLSQILRNQQITTNILMNLALVDI